MFFEKLVLIFISRHSLSLLTQKCSSSIKFCYQFMHGKTYSKRLLILCHVVEKSSFESKHIVCKTTHMYTCSCLRSEFTQPNLFYKVFFGAGRYIQQQYFGNDFLSKECPWFSQLCTKKDITHGLGCSNEANII